ncbi:MAG: hypothetical protein ACUVRV_01910 [Cyanobacteriota bacterium]
MNQGSTPTPLHILPTFWFGNIWSWNEGRLRPQLRQVFSGDTFALIEAEDRRTQEDPFFPSLGKRWLYAQISNGYPSLLFTENEINYEINYAAVYNHANVCVQRLQSRLPADLTTSLCRVAPDQAALPLCDRSQTADGSPYLRVVHAPEWTGTRL